MRPISYDPEGYEIKNKKFKIVFSLYLITWLIILIMFMRVL